MEKKNDRVPLLITIIVAELVLGGAGRLIVFKDFSISERFILFGLGMVYWIYNITKNSQSKIGYVNNSYNYHVILVFLMIIISACIGVLYNNSISEVMTSFQSYMFLLLFFPFIIAIKTKKQALKIFNVFNNCAVILAAIMIVLNIAISLGFSFSILAKFLEKYNMGMISYTGMTPRIFFKGSILIMVAFGNQLLIIINNNNNKILIPLVKLVMLGLATIFSYTMGIWLGASVTVLLVVILQWRKINIRTIFMGLFVLAIIGYLEKDVILNVFKLRMQSTDPSSLVKAQQRSALISLWKTHPFLGLGLGKEVTLITVMGTRTMSQFESTWIQLLMNSGIIGLFIYGSLIIRTCYDGLLKIKNNDIQIRIFGLSVFLSMISLSIVNWFNPVLNNPIGIGYLVISLAILNAIRVDKNSDRKS